jgi:replicative DNA helicase
MLTKNHIKKYHEQLPPQHNLAEEILLGGILINSQVIKIVIRELVTESFALETHQLIYRTIIEVYSEYKYIDSIVLINTLWELNLLNKIGGITKILNLLKQAHIFMSNSITDLTIDYYVSLIKDKYLRRLLVQYGYNIIKLAHISSIAHETIFFKADKYLAHITYLLNQKKQEQVNLLLTNILLNLRTNKDILKNRGLMSGFQSLDIITNGFKNSDLIVIAGRPSMGKTSLALSIVNNLVRANHTGIGIFSLEMSKEQILYKLLAMACVIPSLTLTLGTISNLDWIKVQDASNQLINSSIYIDDTANLSISHLNIKAKALKGEYGKLSLIIIDYLQLIQLPNSNIKNRAEELSSITRILKVLAKDLNTPILVLSQLNRNVEGRVNKKPLLSDLRESGCVEFNTYILIRRYFKSQKYLNDCKSKVQYKLLQYKYLLKGRQGRLLAITHNHFILTSLGWRKGDQVKYCNQIYRKLQRDNKMLYEQSWIRKIIVKGKSKAFDLEVVDRKFFVGNNYWVLHNSIEQDADMVLLLYREAYYNQHNTDNKLTELIIAKHRNGPIGTAKLNFNPDFSAFEDI